MIKKFEGVLVLHWKTKQIRAIKKLRKEKLSPYEIPIRFNIDVELPEQTEHKIKGKIKVPETKVQEMVIEAL